MATQAAMSTEDFLKALPTLFGVTVAILFFLTQQITSILVRETPAPAWRDRRRHATLLWLFPLRRVAATALVLVHALLSVSLVKVVWVDSTDTKVLAFVLLLVIHCTTLGMLGILVIQSNSKPKPWRVPLNADSPYFLAPLLLNSILSVIEHATILPNVIAYTVAAALVIALPLWGGGPYIGEVIRKQLFAGYAQIAVALRGPPGQQQVLLWHQGLDRAWPDTLILPSAYRRESLTERLNDHLRSARLGALTCGLDLKEILRTSSDSPAYAFYRARYCYVPLELRAYVVQNPDCVPHIGVPTFRWCDARDLADLAARDHTPEYMLELARYCLGLTPPADLVFWETCPPVQP